jgi:hypothetical protein
MDSTAPEPGEIAIRHEATKKANQVCTSMGTVRHKLKLSGAS